MHPIRVIRFSIRYPVTSPRDVRCDELEAADMLLRAVTGEPIPKTATVPFLVETGEWLLHEGSRNQAFHWFGRLAAPEIRTRESPVLVPIPNRLCTSPEDVRRSSTFKLAEAAGAECGLAVHPLLYWDGPPKRGLRRAKDLYPLLRMADEPPNVGNVVLIDGLYDRGSLKATEALLRIHGGILIDQALCAGRSVEKPADPVFGNRNFQVERFLDHSVLSIRPRLAK